MTTLIEKLKDAVARRRDGEANGRMVIQDVRRSVMTMQTYRWVLISVLIYAAYYAFYASDRFVTETKLYVRSTEAAGPALNLPAAGLLGAGAGVSQDVGVVSEYIHSLDMLRHLQEEIDILGHYSSADWDVFSRLSSEPSQEGFLAYYQEKVAIRVIPESSILVIRAQGFTREYSKKIVQAITEEAGRYINGVGQQIAQEEIAFVEKELNRARLRLSDVQERMLAFQADNTLLDPAATAGALQAVVSELEAELVRLRTEEKTLLSYLNEEAAQVVSVRSRIDATDAQLNLEKNKLANQGGTAINTVNADFRAMELELEFATRIFQSTMSALEQTRVEAYRKQKHLVVVQGAYEPDDAIYPRKLYNILTLLVTLSLAYGIVVMTFATIREHRDV